MSCDYHDAAAALVVDGEVVAAAEEERFSRRKHDPAIPAKAVAACLDIAGLTAADIDHVAFYEKPLVLAARFLATRQRQGPAGLRPFLAGTPDLVSRNVFIAPRVARLLRGLGAARPPPLQFVEHHHSHAAAAFHPSPFAHAAVLTIDGLGEWSTATIGVGGQHRLRILEEQRFPASLGLVYSAITAHCGFRPNDDEYKLMGLAPYGEPRFADALVEVASVDDDGTLHVDARALGWFSSRGRRRRLDELFGGPPRPPDAPLTAREADLAASVQQLTETAVLAMARRAHELTGESDLCLAGGVALNCVANGRLLREGPFDRVWVQPAAGDAGSSIGAALALWHDVLGRPRAPRERQPDGMSGSLLGPAPAPGEARLAAEAEDLAHLVITDPTARASLVADRLADGAVVGVCQGRMEFGPRALGHRSILADPRAPDVRSRINAAVKGRESFRPFAPAVLAEHAAAWFDLDQPSPYMLLVAPLRAKHRLATGEEPDDLAARAAIARSTIPACTHVDGSARVQTVDATQNPAFHLLLEAFHARTDCPVLLNTSFNRAGEPIVATPADAVRTAIAAGLDLLVVDDVVVEGAALAARARRT